MLRGRIVSANGIPAENLKPKDDAAWVLQSDRGITYGGDIPDRLAAGRGQLVGRRITTARRWCRSRRRSPTASASSSATRSSSTCSAATSPPRIANMRTVDWQSLGINFVMVFSPQCLPRRAADASRDADLSGRQHAGAGRRHHPRGRRYLPDGHHGAGQGSAGSGRRHRRQSGAGDPRRQRASRCWSAALVLGGALAAGHRHRVYDAVILKTLGATRLRLLAAYTIEYLLLGDRHRGVRRAERLARRLADRDRADAPAIRLAAAAGACGGTLGAVVVTVALGLVGTFAALGPETGPGIEKSIEFGDIPPRGQPDLARHLAYNGRTDALTIRNDACHDRAISGANTVRTLHSGTRARRLPPARLT